jgi:lysophospholipase L1-like esterase
MIRKYDRGSSMKGKIILKEIGKITAATLLMFVAFESLLRLAYFLRNSMVDYVVLPYNAAQDFGPVPPWVDGFRILEPDETFGWRNRSGVQRSYMDVYSPVQEEKDRTALLRQFFPVLPAALKGNPVWNVSLNSQGFRDRELPRRKSPSAFRILCIGDSWTFGANVDQEKAYPQRLEGLLKEEFPQAGFEVFNLGVMAYSSHQGIELFRRMANELAPDFVLIGFGMNDASVAGYRDKDMPRDRLQGTMRKKAVRVLEKIETYKLLRYLAQVIRHKPGTIGEYMQKVATSAGTEAEVWIGGMGNETADYEKLEQYTRVSPSDYENNIVLMIHLARTHGAGVILLYNELWDTPYRTVLERISRENEVPLVDSNTLIDRARAEIERTLEEKLNLYPNEDSRVGSAGVVEVVFRVYSGDRPASRAIYISGTHPKLGDGIPNQVAMMDDRTHGDQKAGDHVWSYAATFSPGTRLFYVYTNSGEKGRWTGLDIPEIRRYTVPAEKGKAKVFRPIETFGKMYMQADGWHTNAAGYELIARAVLEKLKDDEKVKNHLARTGRREILNRRNPIVPSDRTDG